jgi:predicted lipoprotein with Yx(FWY)xxD motif
MMRRSRLTVAVCAFAAAGLLAACSSESLPTQPPPPAATGGSAQKSPPAADGGGQGATTVLAVTRTEDLGNVVTDQDGRVLYRFERDETDPPKATCSGQCAVKWPPALVGSTPVELRGVANELVNTVKRADGREQLTLGGRPLYRYSKDKAPGKATGNGNSSTWFAVTPTGQKADKAAVEGAVLVATRSDQLGTIVVDADGYTLYRFDRDTANPPRSNCVGACAKTWPPAVVTSDDTPVDGIDRSLVDTIVRPDGTKQLTIGGWPVYGYSQDKAAGDVKGNGVGGTWFAVSPTGQKAAQ